MSESRFIPKPRITTADPDAALREALRKVITDWGLDQPTSDPPHGWRCQYPQLSDPATCGHVDELVNDLVLAATGSPDYAAMDAKAKADILAVVGVEPPIIDVISRIQPPAALAADRETLTDG